MKTKEVKPIQRNYQNYGSIQLWIDDKGRLFTFGKANPRFKWAAGQEVVLMTAKGHKQLLGRLWEQQYLIQCA